MRDLVVITAVFLGLVLGAAAMAWPAWRLIEAFPGDDAVFAVSVIATLVAYGIAARTAMLVLALYRHRTTSEGRNQNS